MLNGLLFWRDTILEGSVYNERLQNFFPCKLHIKGILEKKQNLLLVFIAMLKVNSYKASIVQYLTVLINFDF